MGQVVRLWRYPIKSMAGEQVDQFTIDSRGVRGDRSYAVITEAGKLGSGKNTRRMGRVDGLLRLTATCASDGVPVVTLPDGSSIRVDDPEAARRISDCVDQQVSVAVESDVSHFDTAPIHLVSEASIAWLAQRTPGVVTDERRLRPNIVIAMDGDALAEEAFVGATIRVGDVGLRVFKRTERCVMTGMAQVGLAEAPTALRSIAQDNESFLGIYAEVETPGDVRVGDKLTRG